MGPSLRPEKDKVVCEWWLTPTLEFQRQIPPRWSQVGGRSSVETAWPRVKGREGMSECRMDQRGPKRGAVWGPLNLKGLPEGAQRPQLKEALLSEVNLWVKKASQMATKNRDQSLQVQGTARVRNSTINLWRTQKVPTRGELIATTCQRHPGISGFHQFQVQPSGNIVFPSFSSLSLRWLQQERNHR